MLVLMSSLLLISSYIYIYIQINELLMVTNIYVYIFV
jgi:hypothetical protein